MSPHRLKSRLDIRIEAAGVTPPTFRFWLISRTPTVMIDYLFEILLAALAVVSSLGFLTGFTSSRLAGLLPFYVSLLYSITLLLGAAVVVAGLWVKKYGTVVSYGLHWLAYGLVAYSIATVWYVGLRPAVTTVTMALVFATLCAWRAFLLRSTYLLIASTRGTAKADRED